MNDHQQQVLSLANTVYVTNHMYDVIFSLTKVTRHMCLNILEATSECRGAPHIHDHIIT
jgi:hypothetical protein